MNYIGSIIWKKYTYSRKAKVKRQNFMLCEDSILIAVAKNKAVLITKIRQTLNKG